MSSLDFSNVLTTSYWGKQVGSVEKPAKVPALLTELKKRFDALPRELLELKGIDTADDAEQRTQDLASDWDKAAKALDDQAQAVADAAGDCAARFKKDAGVAKNSAAPAASVAKEAAALGKAVLAAGAAARAALKTLSAKLDAEAKKADKDAKKDKEGEKDDEAEQLANEKDEKKFRKTMSEGMKSVLRKLKGDGAPPAKFRAVVMGKNWGVCLHKSSNGESQKKLAVRLLGAQSGFKDCKGTVHWNPTDKVFVFEGANVPAGAANSNAMAIALKALLGFRPKVRLQKPGERGEDSEAGEADPDEKPDPKKAGAEPPSVEPVKAFTARLDAMKGNIQEALKVGGDLAKQIQDAVADAGKLAQRKQVDLAGKMLDQVEVLAEKARAALKATGKTDLDALGKAGGELATARQAVADGIGKLADMIVSEYADDKAQAAAAKQAADRLRDLGKALKTDLEKLIAAAVKEKDPTRRGQILKGARTSLGQIRVLAQNDPLMKEIDGNELLPSMQVVKPMLDVLSKVQTALG